MDADEVARLRRVAQASLEYFRANVDYLEHSRSRKAIEANLRAWEKFCAETLDWARWRNEKEDDRGG